MAPDEIINSVNAIYIEFQNGEDIVETLPDPTAIAHNDYYNALRLNTSGIRTFIKCPIAAAVPDTDKYVFQCIITDKAGFNGHSISGSRIYGCALVNDPTVDCLIQDISKDNILNRYYFPPEHQMLGMVDLSQVITITADIN